MKEKDYVLRLSPDQHSALCVYLSSMSLDRENRVKFYQEHARKSPDDADRCQKVIDIYQTVDRIRDQLWNLTQREG
jgi:hypothetical protein